MDNMYKLVSSEQTDPPCNCVGKQNGEPFCPCLMNKLKAIGLDIPIEDKIKIAQVVL